MRDSDNDPFGNGTVPPFLRKTRMLGQDDSGGINGRKSGESFPKGILIAKQGQ